jgi:arylsulfatase A-like enzyme
MSTRLYAITALLFTLTSSLFGADQPNIILMMADDHGWEETGYNGHPHVKTPVLDEMAASGLRMNRFYAAHANCGPTRASFLTGRHPNRMGTFTPGWSIRPEEISIAHQLKQAGYHCAHFGKWHVGPVKASSPTSPGAMGFHEWLSHDNFFEINPSLSRNGGPPAVFKGESSEILVNEAIQSIERNRQSGKPIFQVIWFGSPHDPYSGLPEDLALYDDLPAKYADKKVKLTSNKTGTSVSRPLGDVLRERYAEITAMDRAIGQLRKYLATSGMKENTLLFYCGDNGTPPHASLASPHRGAKGDLYEGGTLVPGLIEWPARIPKPRSTNFRATTSDLLPTLSAITHQPLPKRPLDGMDLSSLLDDKIQTRPAALHFWEFNIDGQKGNPRNPYLDPKLQEGTTPLVTKLAGKNTRNFTNFHHPVITDADYLGTRTVIDGNYKLVIKDTQKAEPKLELFDLQADPAEATNIISKEPTLAKKLQANLRLWQESVLQSLTGADYKN